MTSPDDKDSSPDDLSQTYEHGDSERHDSERRDIKNADIGNSDLYATIKKGTAKVESLKLLIDGFEILEELGRGAFGVVYRARDEKLDRQVAIKVSLLDDPSRREQYVKEAKNAAKLDNPGIVPVFQVGTLAGGQPFVVQRLIDGNTLRQILNGGGPMDVHHACWMMAEIAGAVAKAHAVGMVHRDLKPDNILVDSSGKPWVADFGLAILEEDQGQHRGEKAGTPLYMSPEQLRGKTEWLDGRADIYALGVMFYEMLVGRTPFEAKTLAELEEQVLHRDPKPISQRSPDIPAVVDIIFQNCCAKKVNDRYSNAYELVSDLESVMAEVPMADTQAAFPSRVYGSSAITRKSMGQVGLATHRKTMRSTMFETGKDVATRRQSTPIALALVALILLLGGAYFVTTFFRDSDAEQLVEIDGQKVAPAIPTETQQSPTPQRPFRVSKGSDGTHSSIRAAIAMAEVGETITVLPGTYIESIVLERDIRLVGEGMTSEIVIVGESNAALTVQKGVQAEVKNLTLEGNTSGGKEFNTVEVAGGTLTLLDCSVYSRSYDCLKIQPGSILTANQCRFRSTAHPAINATDAKGLEVVGCSFEIKPQTLEDKSIPVGIQVINSGGTVRRCDFAGSGSAIGIHWKGGSERVTLQELKIENCGNGIVLQECLDIQLKGTDASRLVGCMDGVLVERCTGVIDDVLIAGNQGKTGVRVVDTAEIPATPSIQLVDVKVSGYATSFSVEHAHVSCDRLISERSEKVGLQVVSDSLVIVRDSEISESEVTGILVEDSQVTLTDCNVSKHKYAGVSVDGDERALTSVRSSFAENLAGVIVYAGTVALDSGSIRNNSAGLLVLSREQMGKQVDRGSELPEITLFIDNVSVQGNENGGLRVQTPCKYRINAGSLGTPANADSIRIDSNLRSEKSGEFVVVKPN